MLNISNTNHGK